MSQMETLDLDGLKQRKEKLQTKLYYHKGRAEHHEEKAEEHQYRLEAVQKELKEVESLVAKQMRLVEQRKLKDFAEMTEEG